MELTAKLDSNNIILLGDFNARTGNLKDILTAEKHSNDVPKNFYSNIKTNRSNQDQKTNKYGKKLTEYCIATHSYIANGRTLGDLQGKVTCYERGGCSTVDYAIINENLHSYVETFHVLEPAIGSDHCPIKLQLNIPNICLDTPLISDKDKPAQLKWDDNTNDLFLVKINSQGFKDRIQRLHKQVDRQDDLNQVIGELNKIYEDSITAKKKPSKKNKQIRKKHKPKKWYDQTCYEVSKRLKLVAKLCAKTPNNPTLRGSLIKTTKEYKRLLKHKKREFNLQMIKQLERADDRNPKEYWKLVNELREKKRNKTTGDSETFTTFFENLYAKDNTVRDKEIEDFDTSTLNNESITNNEDTNHEKTFTIEELTGVPPGIESLKSIEKKNWH